MRRIAVVDWDVHHGNGTQDIRYEDPTVLTISIHQHLCFPPESGYREERGAGDGFGYAINVPLPPGSGDAAYSRRPSKPRRAWSPSSDQLARLQPPSAVHPAAQVGRNHRTVR
ncbi:hypothetical protein LTT66_32310 [Nocardia gipuzkoensis]|uniref:hypothetical protein n=1 Tax=Nocardia gipuzkoensis TaxID=2749991 RepID=UPI001E2A988D|nr:hypothetical protein [Nocardia gipuzkoensis]UGT67814.1 hypothetical protein LTT66_32310 [Nocardia gipuzkoensis]